MMRPAWAVRHLSAPLLTSMLSACALTPAYHTPSAPVPEHFVAADAVTTNTPAVDPAHWWQALHDPQLDALVEAARRNNLDIEIALERLQQARAFEAVISGSALPQVGVGAGGGRGTGSDSTRGRLSNGLRDGESAAGLRQIAYGAGFDASWTLDLFGLYRSELAAAAADRAGAEAARQAVIVAVTANVVQAYEDLGGLKLQQTVLEQNVALNQRLEEVVAQRYEHGLTNALDLTLARRQLGTLRAQAAPLRAQADAARDALAVLTGQFPEQLATSLRDGGDLPALATLPPGVQPGLPIELIERRPDIRQTERALASASAQVGVATARLMPSLVLNGGLGLEGQSLAAGGDRRRHIWSAGGGAYWNLLDFGVLDGLVEVADFEVKARAAAYRRAILQAVSEVDTAQSGYQAQTERIAALAQALKASSEAVRLARERYDRGLTDFLNVVDAERQQFELEAQYAQAQTLALDQYVALYRALGGGWESAPDVPPIRAPEPALLAAFHRLWPGAARVAQPGNAWRTP